MSQARGNATILYIKLILKRKNKALQLVENGMIYDAFSTRV